MTNFKVNDFAPFCRNLILFSRSLTKYKRWQASFDKVLISFHMWYFLYHVVLKFSFCMEKKVHLNLFNYLPASDLILPKQMALTFFFFCLFMFQFCFVFFFLKLCSHFSKSETLACFLRNYSEERERKKREDQVEVNRRIFCS